VRHEEFAREFVRAAGAHGEFLNRVPVWLNRHPQSGLWGAAEAGAMLAHSGSEH
jgi:glucokinase